MSLQRKITLLDISADPLAHAFSFCTIKTFLATRRTCKYLYNLTQPNHPAISKIWKAASQRLFHNLDEFIPYQHQPWHLFYSEILYLLGQRYESSIVAFEIHSIDANIDPEPRFISLTSFIDVTRLSNGQRRKYAKYYDEFRIIPMDIFRYDCLILFEMLLHHNKSNPNAIIDKRLASSSSKCVTSAKNLYGIKPRQPEIQADASLFELACTNRSIKIIDYLLTEENCNNGKNENVENKQNEKNSKNEEKSENNRKQKKEKIEKYKNNFSESMIHRKRKNKHLWSCQLLIDTHSLAMAIIYCNCDTLKRIVKHSNFDCKTKLNEFFAYNTNINGKSKQSAYFDNALTFACRNFRNMMTIGEELDIVQLIIDNGGDINFIQQANRFTSQDSFRPIHIAIESGEVNLVRLLLSYSKLIDINGKTLFGDTPLSYALSLRLNWESEIVKSILDFAKKYDIKLDLNSSNHKKDMPPLLQAAANGDDKMCEYLIKNGCNPMVTNKGKRNGLMIAVSHRHLNVAKAIYNSLVSRMGEEIQVATNYKDDKDPEEKCNCRINSQSICNFVDQALGDGRTPYIEACIKRDRNMINFLVNSCNVDVTKTDKYGRTGSDYVDKAYYVLKNWIRRIERNASK